MNFKNKTIAILFFFLATINIEASTIKHIFIDINTIIKPSQTAASKVVGTNTHTCLPAPEHDSFS